MSETSPLLPRAMTYARPSTLEKIQLFFILLPLPIILIWTALFRRSDKGLKRAVLDRALRYVINSLNIRQLQYCMGTTRDVYDKWIKTTKLEPIVEDVEGVTKLLWVGERVLDKVILYLHGGGFLLPPPSFSFSFLYHIQTQLGLRNINVGIAVLQYDLAPEVTFPTPLRQAVTAINYLMELGVDPQNIQFIGDAAGGNLVLQILGHILHPIKPECVPPLSLSPPFLGAYLMSPWVDLSNVSHTLESGDNTDILTSTTIKYWGSQILAPVAAKNRGYVEPNSVAENWWRGVDSLVDRVLITAGDRECFKHEIVRFDARFKESHSNVMLVVQDGGGHNDPMFDFGVGKSDGETTTLVIDWLTAGFQELVP